MSLGVPSWATCGYCRWVRRVLIAEDEPEIRFLYSRWLGRAGYETIEVDAGDLAVSACEAESFDVVLLDVMMPGLDGYTACEQIRSSGSYVPIVMMSALTRPKDIERGLAAGASMYVEKAVSEEELLGVLQQALSLS